MLELGFTWAFAAADAERGHRVPQGQPYAVACGYAMKPCALASRTGKGALPLTGRLLPAIPVTRKLSGQPSVTRSQPVTAI
jgi:hypothetical protein